MLEIEHLNEGGGVRYPVTSFLNNNIPLTKYGER